MNPPMSLVEAKVQAVFETTYRGPIGVGYRTGIDFGQGTTISQIEQIDGADDKVLEPEGSATIILTIVHPDRFGVDQVKIGSEFSLWEADTKTVVGLITDVIHTADEDWVYVPTDRKVRFDESQS